MIDIRKLDYFYYSQNSLNTFEQCPLKFKLKYMDNIKWKKDEDEKYYENMKVGLDYHLLCERYFSNIPIPISEHEKNHEELSRWVNNLKEVVPKVDENIYLPEYEIKMMKDSIKIQAKYDLIILKPNKEIEIWDWKTEERKLKKSEMENRIQTIVYMYMLKENAKEIFGIDVEFENIKMIFWQPHYKEDKIVIEYSKNQHLKNEGKIKDSIDQICNYKFDTFFDKELYKRSCKYCEFNYLCNISKFVPQ